MYEQPMAVIYALQRMNKLPSPPPPVWSFAYLRHAMASALLTTAAALFSPTAQLHFFTGITLIAAYVHARALHMHSTSFVRRRFAVCLCSRTNLLVVC